MSSECATYCDDHKVNHDMIRENAICIKTIKRDRDRDVSMFKWLMSAVGVVAMLILITLMAQAGTMAEMKADLRVLTAKSTHDKVIKL